MPYYGPTEAHVQLLREHATRFGIRSASSGEVDVILGLDEFGRLLSILGEALSSPPQRTQEWGEWGSVWLHPWMVKTWIDFARAGYEGELRLRRPWGDEEMIHALLH